MKKLNLWFFLLCAWKSNPYAALRPSSTKSIPLYRDGKNTLVSVTKLTKLSSFTIVLCDFCAV